MKSSEAKPLSVEELLTLKSLLQRWILLTYPYSTGCSEESDAYTTYEGISSDVNKLKPLLSQDTDGGERENKLE